MYTAVIGLGNIGSQVSRDLTAGGESIIVADRTLAKAQALAVELGEGATAMPVDEAISRADVVILAIDFDAIKELVTSHHSAFAGKIVVDPSNPLVRDGKGGLVPDGKGGLAKSIPTDQSSGQIIARMMPEGAEFVKAFGTVKAASLTSGANRSPERAVLFYATDFPEAGRAIAKLITASGFAPVSVGAADQSIRIEVGGDLHEVGKLGRLVSVAEARALV